MKFLVLRSHRPPSPPLPPVSPEKMPAASYTSLCRLLVSTRLCQTLRAIAVLRPPASLGGGVRFPFSRCLEGVRYLLSLQLEQTETACSRPGENTQELRP